MNHLSEFRVIIFIRLEKKKTKFKKKIESTYWNRIVHSFLYIYYVLLCSLWFAKSIPARAWYPSLLFKRSFRFPAGNRSILQFYFA